MKKRITLDDLARLVKQGFDDMSFSNDSRFTKLEQGLSVLEDGQAQIKLRLDNVAYRFEINELNSRVDRIEHKLRLV